MTKIKILWKSLAIILVCGLLFTLIPITVSAATPVSDEATFATAIGSPNFDIQLNGDFAITTAKTFNNSGRIDLNGHTITCAVNNNTMTISYVATVTITNSSQTDPGVIQRSSSAVGGYLFTVQGNLILQSEDGAKDTVVDGGAIWNTNSAAANYSTVLGRVLSGSATTANTTASEYSATPNPNLNNGLVSSGALITVTKNAAATDGGKLTMNAGSVLQNNMTWSSNGGFGGGGAVILNTSGNMDINGGTIQDCAVAPGTSGTAGGNGGAIYVSAYATLNMSGGLITRCHPSYTSARGGMGGAVYINMGLFNMSGGTISNNLAANGGGVYTAQSATVAAANSRFHMTGGVIDGNWATYGGGLQNNSYIGNNPNTSSDPLTDAAGNDYYSAMLLEKGTISNNTAVQYGGGVDNDCTNSGNNRNARITILGVTITGNKETTTGTGATYGGAGICIRTSSLYSYNAVAPAQDINIIKGATITDNISGSGGGGVYLLGNYTNVNTFENNVITKNQAVNGGGVYISASSAALASTRNTIQGNTATTNGGGLYIASVVAAGMTINDQSDDGVTDRSISGNTAYAAGGGIYDAATNPVALNSTQVSGNTASNSAGTAGNGGGIYMNAGTLNLNAQSAVAGNTAAVSGGGVYMNAGTVNMNAQSVMTANTTGVSGGGVYVYRGTFKMAYNAADTSLDPALYGNIANLALDNAAATSDDVYASGTSTTVTLLAAADMPLPSSFLADGWYNDFVAAGVARYRDGQRDGYAVSSTTAIANTLLRLTLGGTVYTVTYEGNGNTDSTAPEDTGGNAPTDSNGYYDGSPVTVLDKGDLAKTHYTFIGWATSKAGADAGTVDYSATDSFTITEDMTLYAVWQENDIFTVTYNGNGNTGGTAPADTNGNAPADSNSYYDGSTVTVSDEGNLVKTNFAFVGWATSQERADAGTVDYSAAGTFTITENMTLFAVWQENGSYTVTYSGNGNTGGTAPADTSGNAPAGSDSYYTGSTVTVSNEGDLVRAGYTFMGWATSQERADAGTVDYKADDTFIISADTTLYAVWQVNGTLPPTGDTGDLALWLILITISGIALLFARKRVSHCLLHHRH